MKSIDPLLMTLYAGIACSIVVTVVGIVLGRRLRPGHHVLGFVVTVAGCLGLLAGGIMTGAAIEAPREIDADEYAMLLTTLTARPEMARPFKAAMRDGRITRLELRRITAGFPMVELNSMRGVAQIVARDLP